VYDAITADRCFHKGMPAAEALRQMYEWSKFHFNPALTQEFMVNVFYSMKSQTYIKPQTVDLARGVGYGSGDKIVRHEAPEKWQVDPPRFMQLA
jgi:hypothetical protein